MIWHILLLCFLTTALGWVLHPDKPIPDYRYRRQVGDTRDDRAPPQFRNLLRTTRRQHKPVLRNEIPDPPDKKPVLFSQELLPKKVFKERSDVNHRPRLRGDNYKHWIRKEDDNKPSKRVSSGQKALDGGNKDAEVRDDKKIMENDKPNGGTIENNDLPRPENDNNISEPNLDPSSSQDQRQEINSPQGQAYGYNAPQGQGQDYNSSQDQNQGLDDPQNQIQGHEGLQRQLRGPMTPRSLGPDYSAYPAVNQGYQSPQTLGQNQDFNGYQGAGQKYNSPQELGQNKDYKAYQGVGQDYNPPQGSGPHGLGSAPQGPGYPPPDFGQEYNAYQGVRQDYIAPQGPGKPPQGVGNSPGYPLPDFGQEYLIYPSQCHNQVGDQGQIFSTCQNQIQDNCHLTGQCYPSDNMEVRKKILQLIRDTKLGIYQKVMPIREVHLAYKTNTFYKIGYLVSSINRTHDSVADFYKYVEQNINSWDILKVLQAYEQVKLADAFVTDVLYTLNQLASTVSALEVMRAGKPSVKEPKISRKGNAQIEYDGPPKLLDDEGWTYYED